MFYVELKLFLRVQKWLEGIKSALPLSRCEDNLYGEPSTIPKDNYNKLMLATATPCLIDIFAFHLTQFLNREESINISIFHFITRRFWEEACSPTSILLLHNKIIISCSLSSHHIYEFLFLPSWNHCCSCIFKTRFIDIIPQPPYFPMMCQNLW